MRTPLLARNLTCPHQNTLRLNAPHPLTPRLARKTVASVSLSRGETVDAILVHEGEAARVDCDMCPPRPTICFVDEQPL